MFNGEIHHAIPPAPHGPTRVARAVGTLVTHRALWGRRLATHGTHKKFDDFPTKTSIKMVDFPASHVDFIC